MLVIDRIAYVSSMANRAMAAGADYKLGQKVERIEISDRGVSVSATNGAGRQDYRAEVVIIASGFHSPLLNMVGLGSGQRRDYMKAVQAEVSVDHLDDLEVHLGDHVAPGSFGWLVPISDSRALMGLVSRQQLNGHFEKFVSDARLSGSVQHIVEKPRKWGIPVQPLSKTYRDRVLVVGDAAGLVKPITGGGIYYALLSGKIAAETANEAFVVNDFSNRTLQQYQKRWQAILGKELRTGRLARRLYETLGESQIESLVERFASQEVQDELLNGQGFSFDWHSAFVLKMINHRDLGPLIRSFGPAIVTLLSSLVRPKG